MSPTPGEALDALLTRFDEEWQSGAPKLEDHLPPPGSGLRLPALLGLIRIDLERRLAAGQCVRVERHYLGRYPELRAEAEAVLGLIVREWELRRRQQSDLSPDEYLERFPEHRE